MLVTAAAAPKVEQQQLGPSKGLSLSLSLCSIVNKSSSNVFGEERERALRAEASDPFSLSSPSLHHWLQEKESSPVSKCVCTTTYKALDAHAHAHSPTQYGAAGNSFVIGARTVAPQLRSNTFQSCL